MERSDITISSVIFTLVVACVAGALSRAIVDANTSRGLETMEQGIDTNVMVAGKKSVVECPIDGQAQDMDVWECNLRLQAEVKALREALDRVSIVPPVPLKPPAEERGHITDWHQDADCRTVDGSRAPICLARLALRRGLKRPEWKATWLCRTWRKGDIVPIPLELLASCRFAGRPKPTGYLPLLLPENPPRFRLSDTGPTLKITLPPP